MGAGPKITIQLGTPTKSVRTWAHAQAFGCPSRGLDYGHVGVCYAVHGRSCKSCITSHEVKRMGVKEKWDVSGLWMLLWFEGSVLGACCVARGRQSNPENPTHCALNLTA